MSSRLLTPSPSESVHECPADAASLRNNMSAEIFRDSSEGDMRLGPGLLFTSAETPVPSTTTTGGCQGPGKTRRGRKKNFPLTQEIGTSCAATQSNHLSYFTDRTA